MGFFPPRYIQTNTFARLPSFYDGVLDIALCGIPYDGATTYRPGARYAPENIRAASRLIASYSNANQIDLFKNFNIADLGDIDVSVFSMQQTFESITTNIARILQKSDTIGVIGGDHSITLPVIRAIHSKYGTVAVIHFDAHSDTCTPGFDTKYHHGNSFWHLVNEQLLLPSRSIQVGLRSTTNSRVAWDFAKEHYHHITSEDIHYNNLEKFDSLVKDLEGTNVYISFDIDCIDPAYAPATGTPVPGGISSFQAISLLRKLKKINIVGFDLVEVAPNYDNAEITSVLAATIIYEIMCAKARL